jgi:hypothetical protein
LGSAAQARAVRNYRKRLKKTGMARFEVVGLDRDRDLIRKLARKLADESKEAAEIRASLATRVDEQVREKGAIWAALRRWPIADLDLTREYTEGRKIDL